MCLASRNFLSVEIPQSAHVCSVLRPGRCDIFATGLLDALWFQNKASSAHLSETNLRCPPQAPAPHYHSLVHDSQLRGSAASCHETPVEAR